TVNTERAEGVAQPAGCSAVAVWGPRCSGVRISVSASFLPSRCGIAGAAHTRPRGPRSWKSVVTVLPPSGSAEALAPHCENLRCEDRNGPSVGFLPGGGPHAARLHLCAFGQPYKTK